MQANKCSDKLKWGRVSVRQKAGVQSTFSTTLNKKSHAKLTLTLTGLTQFVESKAPEQGKLKLASC